MKSLTLIASLGAFVFSPLAQVSAQAQETDFNVETIAEGLDHPWSIAFVSQTQALVTEKPGRLSLLDTESGDLTVITGTPEVLYSGQGGLQDVVLHPDFDTNQLVYLSWSKGEVRDNTLALGRGRLVGDALIDFEEIFNATPNRQTDVHYGARLVFLPDNSLLLTIGDGFDFREQAQRAQNHFGSIVHLHDDGTPFDSAFEGAAPGVYSIGHRNPQALVFDPATGTIYSHEHGPMGGDEINVIVEGANYGWPITSYGIDYTGALVTPFTLYEGMSEPLMFWVPSIAPAGMAIYHGEMFADWDGDLLVTALMPGEADTVSGHLRRIVLEDGEVVDQHILLGELETRLRDVRIAPDGSIYVLTDEENGRVLRLVRE